MAVYKVIQDVEADDKLLGPLSLKQFIYAAITMILVYIDFRLLVATELGPIRWGVIFVLLMPAILFGALAAPFGRDQPTEVWLLARVRFFFKPRTRIWNQSGVSELVTITVPKREEKHYAKDLSQTEVRSRLSALANTLDSRGWAVKNVNVNLYTGTSPPVIGEDSDRLIGASSLPQAVPTTDITAADDILDEQHNATAHHFRDLVSAATVKSKQQLTERLNAVRDDPNQVTRPTNKTEDKSDYWFMNESQKVPESARGENHAVFARTAVATPDGEPGEEHPDLPVHAATDVTSADEHELLKKLHSSSDEMSKHHPHYKRAMSLSEERRMAEQETRARYEAARIAQAQATSQQAMTAQRQTAILEPFAHDMDDLKVATLATQAKRKVEQVGPDEVVISVPH